MKSSLLVAVGTLFLAVGCAHQGAQPAGAVKVVVNASRAVARQFDAVALQRAAELELSRVTLTNPRPVKLTVDIDLDSTDELFYQPHEHLQSGKTISWMSVFDGTASSDEMRPVALRSEKSGRAVVVGNYKIIGEMGAIEEWQPIVLLATDSQVSGPRAEQQMRAAARFLAERVMLVDERMRHAAVIPLSLGRRK
jgi:hypothetical protein